MWPLIIGAVSQANDPAKKLADDYCAHVLSQGGAVDYATVYNLYKNTYLPDPDKDKLKIWIDVRAGKHISPDIDYDGVFDLIYPYNLYSFSSVYTRFNVVGNFPELTGGGSAILIFDPTPAFNESPLRIRKEFLAKKLTDVTSHAYLDIIRGTSQGGTFQSIANLRLISNDKMTSYLCHNDGTSDVLSSDISTYGVTEFYVRNTVDYQTGINSITVDGIGSEELSFSTSKQAALPIWAPDVNYLYMILSETQIGIAKYYKL